MQHAARTLFACWLVVVTTGTVVTHRHAAARGHTHGLGCASLPVESAPGGGLPAGHCHFVLLGVEFGATPSVPDGTAPEGPRVSPVADTPAPSGEVTEVPPGPDAVTSTAGPPVLTTSPGCTPRLSNALNSCPLTSFARTGVLRA